MMKWIQFLLVLFLIPGFPLFQCDQAIDLHGWSAKIPSLQNQNMHLPMIRIYGSIQNSIFFRSIESFSQLKNPFSVLHSFSREFAFLEASSGVKCDISLNHAEGRFLLGLMTSPYIIRRCKHGLDNWTFGITMVVVGMGGTLLTLWILSLIMSLLKKAFPYKKEEEGK